MLEDAMAGLALGCQGQKWLWRQQTLKNASSQGEKHQGEDKEAHGHASWCP